MLSIQNVESKKCTPNLLPARINHDGPINSTSRYWKPRTDDKGTQHAYFRGRHLYGTSLSLPPNYTGVVLNMTDKLAPPCASEGSRTTHKNPSITADNEEDDEQIGEDLPEEIKIAEQVGDFESIVVWGHGGQVDEGSDMFVRGMREWVGFAESMHCDEEDTATEKQGKGGQTS